MPVIAIGLLLGVLVLCSFNELPSLYWSALIPLVLILAIRCKQHRFIFAVVIGFLWALLQAHLVLKPELPVSLEKQDLLISGKVVSVPKRDFKKVRFDFAPDAVLESPHPAVLPDKIRLSWYDRHVEIHAGEIWQLRVRLKRPHGFMNPGGFDYESYLFQQHIRATGYIRKDEQNIKLSDSGLSLSGIREELAGQIAEVMNQSAMTGLVQALVLGIRDNIDADQWEMFLASGTNHLIAISGLHIGLLSGLGFWLGRWLWSRCGRCCLWLPAVKSGAVVGWLFALVYAALAGFSIPTQRALIMVSVVMLALLTQRSVRPVATLSTSLALVLLWDCFSVLSAGFWLSYFAVAMILWMLGHRSHWKSWQQWLFMQSGLALGLLPLTVWFFQRVSVIAPLANFLVVPVVAFFVVPVVLLATASLLVSDTIATWLYRLADWVLQIVVWFLDYLQQLSFSNLYLAEPSLIEGWLALFAALTLFAPRGLFARGIAPVLFLPLLLNSGEAIEPGDFRVSFLDVGQGLSVVVQTAKHNLLYDTGAKFSDTFNAGDAVVAPFLYNRGIHKLDRIMISHADNDHRGGLPAIISKFPYNAISTSDPQALAKIVTADECFAGQSWVWDDVLFTVLHPEQGWQGGRNNRTCVLKIENNAGSVLLTADIEKQAEKALLEANAAALKSTLLLVPHHGSRTSSKPEFISAVEPEHAVLITGYLNRFGFPKDDVIDRYKSRDIKIHDSVVSGSMQFDIRLKDGISIQKYRDKHSKFWHFRTSSY